MKTAQNVETMKTDLANPEAALNVEKLREDFPILGESVHGKPLVYLDNAATTQKPQQVIDALSQYYSHTNSNVHRGVHHLSEQASQEYEGVRDKARAFFNANAREEIVFVRGTTEGINLVANSYGKANVGEGDEVIISGMEHHSNIVPWQMLCEEKGAHLRVVPILDDGTLDLAAYESMLNERTKLVSVIQASNTLGTINPVKSLIDKAHQYEVPVLLDGAQAPMHMPVDVQELDCDFFVMSGHKLFGPTGIGVLYGKAHLLENMPPYQGGGDMIETVTFEKTTYNEIPLKFEAGTPNIAGTIGMGVAMDYVKSIGQEAIRVYENQLLNYATEALSNIEGLKIIGTAPQKTGVISFIFDDIHPQDVGILLDQKGIAIRTGHHCTQPIMQRYDIPATSRASFAFYNTTAEIDQLVEGIHKVKEIFA